MDKNSISLENGLAPNKRKAIIWTNAEPTHWRIYAALGGDALNLKVTNPLMMLKTRPYMYGYDSLCGN